MSVGAGEAAARRDGGLPTVLHVVGEQRADRHLAARHPLLRLRALRSKRKAAERRGEERWRVEGGLRV